MASLPVPFRLALVSLACLMASLTITAPQAAHPHGHPRGIARMASFGGHVYQGPRQGSVIGSVKHASKLGGPRRAA